MIKKLGVRTDIKYDYKSQRYLIYVYIYIYIYMYFKHLCKHSPPSLNSFGKK